jgi:adenylate cyclase
MARHEDGAKPCQAEVPCPKGAEYSRGAATVKLGIIILNQVSKRGQVDFGIGPLLAVALAGLVGLAVAVVLVIQILVGGGAARDLFREKADLMVELVTRQVREHLDPAPAQLAYIARILPTAPDDLGSERMSDLLTGALAGVPAIQALAFIPADGIATIVNRTADGVEILNTQMRNDPGLRAGVEEARNRQGGWWGELFFARRYDGPVVNRRHAVWRDGEFVGVLGAVVLLGELSRVIEESAATEYGGHPFVLRGRDSVLAHRRLIEHFPGLNPAKPLPQLDEIDDPVLAAIWTAKRSAPFLGRLSATSHVADVGGVPYLYLYRDMSEFGDPAWFVGAYFRVDDIAGGVRTAAMAGLAGLGVLAISVIFAIILARRLAAPTRGFARAATELASLDFSKTSPLPRSRIRELDEQAHAFNRLLSALRWFESYVPKGLVRRLAREAPPESTERELTVMFTDIVGFTTLTQDMPPTRVAELLNGHFAHVINAVEATGGTVDKFMGDGTMAFWGAPDRLPDHARAALICAAEIARAMARTGLRVRIGVHTGRVVVGNVGTTERLNYTIIGDAVNATQRIEQLGKDLMSSEDSCCVLTSAETWHAAGDPEGWTPQGEFNLRGRDSGVSIYRLVRVRADDR